MHIWMALGTVCLNGEQLLARGGELSLLSRPAVRSFEHGVYLGAAENDHC